MQFVSEYLLELGSHISGSGQQLPAHFSLGNPQSSHVRVNKDGYVCKAGSEAVGQHDWSPFFFVSTKLDLHLVSPFIQVSVVKSMQSRPHLTVPFVHFGLQAPFRLEVPGI